MPSLLYGFLTYSGLCVAATAVMLLPTRDASAQFCSVDKEPAQGFTLEAPLYPAPGEQLPLVAGSFTIAPVIPGCALALDSVQRQLPLDVLYLPGEGESGTGTGTSFFLAGDIVLLQLKRDTGGSRIRSRKEDSRE